MYRWTQHAHERISAGIYGNEELLRPEICQQHPTGDNETPITKDETGRVCTLRCRSQFGGTAGSAAPPAAGLHPAAGCWYRAKQRAGLLVMPWLGPPVWGHAWHPEYEWHTYYTG